MASTHNANFKLHLDITAHADDDNDSFNYTTDMKNPNPNPTSVSSSTPPLFCSFFHSSTNLPPFNHHLGVNVNASHEESRTENMEQPLGSSRWNPTPEQLLALEEMYRRGMRTPSAEQIQLIAGHLRRFGKIEGKNVFYWFQNHKARERQKRRRESLETQEEKHHHHDHYHHHETTDPEKKELGMRKGTIYDVEHTKNWTSSSSNWRKQSEEFVSMHTSVVSSNTENGPQRWPQLHSKELQLQRKFNFNLNHHREIFNIVKINQNDQLQETTTTTRTLELFPLHSDENESSKRDNDDDDSMKMNITATINNSGSSFSPRQYIEFLPLKN